MLDQNPFDVPDEESDDEMFEHYRIVADPKQSLIRIDKFLNARLPNVTRTKLQDGIHEGFVKVNDKVVKPNYKIHPHDIITVSLPEPPRVLSIALLRRLECSPTTRTRP